MLAFTVMVMASRPKRSLRYDYCVTHTDLMAVYGELWYRHQDATYMELLNVVVVGNDIPEFTFL